MAIKSSELRSAALGLLMIGVLVLGVVLAAAFYTQAFTTTVPLTVDSSRAGLLMEPGGVVKLRGVAIGTVSSVSSGGPGAVLELAVLPQYLKLIPTNVGAQIVPPTVFGAKYVNLVPPVSPGPPIAAHGVVDASHVTVEANQTFASLMGVLNAASPVAVNDALTALSTALAGNGANAGQFIQLVNSYLGQFNQTLPNLDTDLNRAVPVVNTYANLAPNLVRTATNGAILSNTLVANKAALDAMLLSVTGLAKQTGTLLQKNGTALTKALNVLQPTTSLLAYYAPEFPCVTQALVEANKLTLPVFAGVVPGINVTTQLLPSQDPYTYPKDLSVVGATGPPECYGMPALSTAPLAHYVFNTGTNPYAGYGTGTGTAGTPGGATAALGTTLFGVLAGVVDSAP